MWGKMFLKTSGPKIKVEFKDSVFFTNKIICKKLWKDSTEDAHRWQWQQTSKELLTQQTANEIVIRKAAGGQRKRQKFCMCIYNNGGK